MALLFQQQLCWKQYLGYLIPSEEIVCYRYEKIFGVCSRVTAYCNVLYYPPYLLSPYFGRDTRQKLGRGLRAKSRYRLSIEF